MFKLLFGFSVLAGLPVVFVGVVSLLVWPQLSKPWVFVVSCLVMFYLLYGVMFYFAAPTVISMDLIDPANELTSEGGVTNEAKGGGDIGFPFLTAYLRPIFMFSVTALPTLLLSVKLWRK